MNRLILLLVLFALGCKKSEDRSCWKFNGSTIDKKVDLSDFHKIDLGAFLNYHLIHDSSSFVVLTGGENVLNSVCTTVIDGRLTITNENKCKFLRSLKKIISVEIHYKSLDEIIYQGSYSLTNEGTLSSPKLDVILREGAGSLDLLVNCINLEVSAEPSWTDYAIRGNCNYARLSAKGNAFGDTRELQVLNDLIVISKGTNDLKIRTNSANVLKCETWSSGNVYYTDTPGSIEWSNYGTGKLLQGN
ncbi:MAG: DUF2807 domain-containing protein [Crocinitomicaceae bacterium]